MGNGTPGRWITLAAGLLLAVLLALWPVKLSILATDVPCGPAAYALIRPADPNASDQQYERAGTTACHSEALPFTVGALLAGIATSLVVLRWPAPRRPHIRVDAGPRGVGCVTCGPGWPCRTAWEAGGPIYLR